MERPKPRRDLPTLLSTFMVNVLSVVGRTVSHVLESRVVALLATRVPPESFYSDSLSDYVVDEMDEFNPVRSPHGSTTVPWVVCPFMRSVLPSTTSPPRNPDEVTVVGTTVVVQRPGRAPKDPHPLYTITRPRS